MLECKAFLVLYIPDDAWSLPDEYKQTLEPHKERDRPGYRLPWPTEMIPKEGEEIHFSNILGPDDVVAGKTEYTYSRKSGYESQTEIRLAGDWEPGSLDIHSLATFANEGFVLDSRVAIKDICRCARLKFPKE